MGENITLDLLTRSPIVPWCASVKIAGREGDMVMKYREDLLQQIRVVVDGNESRYEKLKAVCALLKESVPYYNWVGFYLVDAEEKRILVLEAFEGEPTEHVRIPFGSGICGQAADRRETFVVQDVSKEENYLSCSMNVKSEIVLPIIREGDIIGELDIDSHSSSPFTVNDERLLSRVCEIVAQLF
jgi:L-methionine (R)-S-oxide reductase